MNSVHQSEALLTGVLFQLIIMIAAARILNTVFRRLGQPGVIGEIVAGLLLGPSLFGHFFPDLSQAVFGKSAGPAITVISQIGLTLLMFQIGADFEFGHLAADRGRRAAPLIALTSVAVPFALGLGVGLYSAPTLAGDRNHTAYALFMGIGVAITAVPILGRILREFGLTREELGVTAISAAALNDVAGWLILGAVAAFAQASYAPADTAIRIGVLLVVAVAARFLSPPLTRALMARFPLKDGEIPPNLLAILLPIIFAAGIGTAKLGVFTIFGGFAVGLMFHTYPDFVEAWRRQVGQFVLVFFLPVFFTFTGLRTNILGLGVADLGWLALILAVSIGGKMIPIYATARLTGYSHWEAAILGTLMNTRALMELIVLNIGFDLGMIPQNVFTMMVVMAVVTTVMTGPLLRWLLPKIGHRAPVGIEA